jgi:hypothetical protein
MPKLNYTFDFFNTKEEAENFAENYKKRFPYRKKHGANVTEWKNKEGNIVKWICSYYY